jgi:hypothetical protein
VVDLLNHAKTAREGLARRINNIRRVRKGVVGVQVSWFELFSGPGQEVEDFGP